jgi:hypothetical protein
LTSNHACNVSVSFVDLGGELALAETGLARETVAAEIKIVEF